MFQLAHVSCAEIHDWVRIVDVGRVQRVLAARRERDRDFIGQ